MKFFYTVGLLIVSLFTHAQVPLINSTYGLTGNCQALVYGNGVYVAICGGLFTSTDTKIWTPVPSGNIPAPEVLTFGNGVFVAGTPGLVRDIYTSIDGVHWTLRASGLISQY